MMTTNNRKTTFSNATIADYQVQGRLIKALAGKEDPMDVIKVLSEGLFPDIDLYRKAKSLKIQDEVTEYFDKIDKIWIEEQFGDGNEYRINLTFEDSNLIHAHSQGIQQLIGYLADKYNMEMEVSFNTYYTASPSKEDEAPIEKPKAPQDMKQFEVEIQQ